MKKQHWTFLMVCSGYLALYAAWQYPGGHYRDVAFLICVFATAIAATKVFSDAR